jgi:hypothetical protein
VTWLIASANNRFFEKIWPTLLEIVYFQKHCRALPMRHVKNKERSNGRAAP